MTPDLYVWGWFKAWALTTALETPVVVWAAPWSPVPRSRRAVLAVLAQLVTHPLLWFVFTALPWVPFGRGVWLGEVWAVLGEGLLYWAAGVASPARALGLSLAANALSYGVGLCVPL